MIADVLTFLKEHLDDHFRVALGGSQDDPSADKVVFVDGDKMDPISFKLGAVTVLLINVEEDRVLRSPDRYARRTPDGTHERIQPDIRLILYVLFIARFKAYEEAWKHLSTLIEHFQSLPVLDAQNTPALPAGIEKLGLELVTQTFAQQNEVWNALRTTHHPSILYRIKLVGFRDRQPAESPEVRDVAPELQRTS